MTPLTRTAEVAALKRRDQALDAPRSVTVLGATGSIGSNTVALISQTPERFQVEALTAHRNATALARQARQVRARLAVVADPNAYGALKEALSGSGIEVAAGPEAVIEAARRPSDLVMAAIMGAAGLRSTLAAVERGAMVGLANKESLVCAGRLLTEQIARSGAVLLPVDSEHNAIFQVLDFHNTKQVESLTLTASGGPFRTASPDELRHATPEQAVAHPNWSMGAKISVDSATMMNKGLELIEAAYLFPITPEKIQILVHPQSVIHGLVTFRDGSILAQMGAADMRIPIAFTLAWPHRMATTANRLDLADLGQLSFEAPDDQRFPAIAMARSALQMGQGGPTILNAANEVAVDGFLNKKIGFLEICAISQAALEGLSAAEPQTLDEVLELDRRTREFCARLIDCS